jgi:hypothetical protein
MGASGPHDPLLGRRRLDGLARPVRRSGGKAASVAARPDRAGNASATVLGVAGLMPPRSRVGCCRRPVPRCLRRWPSDRCRSAWPGPTRCCSRARPVRGPAARSGIFRSSGTTCRTMTVQPGRCWRRGRCPGARDVVIEATKTGHIFAPGRETGQPVHPVENPPVPRGDVPGEWSAATQPLPVRPPQPVPAGLAPDAALRLTPPDRAICRTGLRALRNEGLFTPPSLQGPLLHTIAGGVNGAVAPVTPGAACSTSTPTIPLGMCGSCRGPEAARTLGPCSRAPRRRRRARPVASSAARRLADGRVLRPAALGIAACGRDGRGWGPVIAEAWHAGGFPALRRPPAAAREGKFRRPVGHRRRIRVHRRGDRRRPSRLRRGDRGAACRPWSRQTR